MLTLSGAKPARVLGRMHSGTIARTLAADPAISCMVACRFEQVGMDRMALGGRFWGVNGGRDALCFDGGNLMPLTGDERSIRRIGRAIGEGGRHGASLVGPAELVLPLWDELSPNWGPARAIRADQPLKTCPGPPAVAPDPRVRVAVPADLDRYFPAAVQMFTVEVGVDPRLPDEGVAYRTRVAALIDRGRAFVRFDTDGRLMFKAEVGSLSSRAALIQGVWVAPEYRGRGLAAPGVARLVDWIQSSGRLPVLYVNDFNTPARAAYRRIGFRRVGSFSSVLL